MKIQRPTTWPETVMFLCQEQQILERLGVVKGGLPTNADDIDLLCLQYGAKHEWPSGLSEFERKAIIRRLEWSREFTATMMCNFRKADGTEMGFVPYPNWDFESMMIWYLVETWHRIEKWPKNLLSLPLPPRPEPQWPPGPETN